MKACSDAPIQLSLTANTKYDITKVPANVKHQPNAMLFKNIFENLK